VARASVRRAALQTAKGIARELAAEGAEAVILMGSWVRGDAHRESDLDMDAIGRGPFYRLERRGPFLVAVSWRTAAAGRGAFRDPAAGGGAVPGWRCARILHDPRGVARALKDDARRWRWASVGSRADAWVAEEFTGYAEEVHKLFANLALRRPWAAAVQRSVLALRMAPILAVRHHILYETENRLWDLVAAKMGPRWRRAQAAAFGVGGESLREGCAAALELFVLAARDVKPLLDHRQMAVVAHACELAGHSM
jgi:hypothetical protein